MSFVDIAFVITAGLLIFNGLKNGFIFSLAGLISLPAAFIVASLFSPQFAKVLANNNLSASPVIAYLVLFFGTVVIIHILATTFRNTFKALPLIGSADTLLGGVVGFVEAWLLWVVVLVILHNFLQDTNQIQALGLQITTFQSWQEFYNTAMTNSVFAKVNSFMISTVPVYAKSIKY
jgi:uncharacterized membrane protein required for colicin V production